MKLFIVLALIACVSAFRLPPAYKQIKRDWQMQPRTMDEDGDKIVGGSTSGNQADWPFIISLRVASSNFHFCGGTIIKSNRVVTAAHCTDGQSASSMEVAGGQLTKNNDYDDNEQIIRVSSYSQHWSYNPSTTNYDFSVLRLSKSFSTNNNVAAIGMGSCKAGDQVYVLGWGATSEGGSSPNKLKFLSIPVISRTECNKAYSGSITDVMVCAGHLNKSGEDSCQGDSGGPLTRGFGKSATLVGVVSWGYGCARYGYPGVYAEVSKVQSWLSSQ